MKVHCDPVQPVRAKWLFPLPVFLEQIARELRRLGDLLCRHARL